MRTGASHDSGIELAAPTPATLAASADVRGPLPLVVGFTGHRVICSQEDAGKLAEAIAGIFRTLATDYPHTPLLLLSALAIGADRIAARVALREEFSIPVIAPLPLERLAYERDFSDDERREFGNLVEQLCCPPYFVGYAPGNDAQTVSTVRAARDRQYAQVGSYIARNSQILIAAWDGHPSEAVGGTAQVVNFKRAGVPPEYEPPRRPLDPPESGPVYHIPTPRNDEDVKRLGDAAFRTCVLRPISDVTPDRESHLPSPETVARATYCNVDRFNERACAIGAAAEQMTAHGLQTTADKLANRYRDATLVTLRGLFLLALATAFTFEVYADVDHDGWWLAADLLLSAIGLGWYAWSRARRLQDCFQDYRAFAEGLRIQRLWQDAGIGESVADHYLRQHRGELDWIRHAIRASRMLDVRAHQADPSDPEARRRQLHDVREAWIEGGTNAQISYFQERVGANERADALYHRCAVGLLVLSIALTLLVWLANVEPPAFPNPIAAMVGQPDGPSWDWLIVAISMTAVGAALAKGYANLCAFAEHRKHYARMLDVFRRARTQLDRALMQEPFDDDHYRAAQSILRDLGEEALAENGAWVMLHRERPLEYPRG